LWGDQFIGDLFTKVTLYVVLMETNNFDIGEQEEERVAVN
jgi:hypothetical protein